MLDLKYLLSKSSSGDAEYNFWCCLSAILVMSSCYVYSIKSLVLAPRTDMVVEMVVVVLD